jgi:zinc protease
MTKVPAGAYNFSIGFCGPDNAMKLIASALKKNFKISSIMDQMKDIAVHKEGRIS